jgi:predicted nuclease of predicted toxin-antitoxin system
MPPRLAFLVDACVDIRLARWLNDQRHDAKHLREEGLQSLPNGQIFAKAIDEGRIVVTHDLDFGEISAFTHGKKTSVIVFRLHNPRLSRLIERLSTVLADCIPALQAGAVVIVEEARHRIRHLPVGTKR